MVVRLTSRKGKGVIVLIFPDALIRLSFPSDDPTLEQAL